MGIDEIGEASRAQKAETPLSQRPLGWWLFYMPGTVILWFQYMFPNSVTQGIAGGRQRNVPLVQLGMTLTLYGGILLLSFMMYVWHQNGEPDDPEPTAVRSTVRSETSATAAATQPGAGQQSGAAAAEEEPPPVGQIEDPMKKEIHARLTPQYTSCMSAALATADMLECISSETKIQDHALNATYKRVMGKLEPEGQATVRQAQRAWIKERDAQCDKEAAEFEGGSLGPVTHADCYLQKEIERTIQLEQIEPR